LGHGLDEVRGEGAILALALPPRLAFTTEPMLNQGRHAVRLEADGWTVVTRDGQLSTQFEHTVAVTRNGVRVLTLRPEERISPPAPAPASA
jgi:methionyl aminopeptidase